MQNGHPIQGLMQATMENLKDMVDVNTIIGTPVETGDGSVIIPVSKVGFGFAAGGSEFKLEVRGSQTAGHPFGGGSGGGVSITPVAFLVVSAKETKMIHMDENTHLYDRLLDLIPQAVDKIQTMMGELKQQNQNYDMDNNNY